MSLTRNFGCTKDKTVRITNKTGQGASDWLIIGRDTSGRVHRVFMDFSGFDVAANWNVGDKIVRVELVITTSDTHNISFGSAPGIRLGRLTGSWSEGNAPDGSWHSDDYTSLSCAASRGPFPLTRVQNDAIYIDVTSLMEDVAPKRVLKRDGTPCGGATFTGLRLWSQDEAKNAFRTEIWGRGANSAPRRPYLRVTYDVGTVPPSAPLLGAPDGDVAPGGGFNGTFVSTQESPTPDTLTTVQVRVWNSAGTTQVGSTITYSATEAERGSGTFSIPMPVWVASGVTYKWDARTADQTGSYGAWAAKKTFKLTSTLPVVVLETQPAPLDTLKNVLFRAGYSDADGNPLQSFRYQVRPQTAESDPAWADALIWDSDPQGPPRANTIEFLYNGPALAANTAYSMRVQAEDSNGSVSLWDYADFSTSANFTTEPEESYPPGDNGDWSWYVGYDETAANQMTGYNRVQSPWRVVLKDMGASRAPGAIKAIITDPINMGASIYGNSPGEFFFTLPAEHPQIGECEPYQRHYSVQRYVGDRWVEKFTGILDDFDATEDEVVFHGVDYFGTLSFAVDERKEGTKSVVLNPPGTGGSKYSEVDISVLIRDQLYQGKNQANSTFGWISIPANATADWAAMTEKVSLATPYSPILGTVTGLIQSHKSGTGRRSRLMVKKTGESTAKWVLYDHYGKDRTDIRLEYGGLVNGYRLVGFGDFGTVVLGMGRQREGVKILYANAGTSLMVGTQTMSEVFGRISKTAVWQDLYDETDLKRRVKERAEQSAKIGKRTALALKVDGLGPLDGYDVMDSVPVVINRGPVQTDRYGSGLWTIHGVAWKLHPDGHEDVVLTVLPKEDGVAISGDLVGSFPLLDEGDWKIDRVPPDPLVSGKYYLNQTTGITYYWDGDMNEWKELLPWALLGTPLPPTVTSALVSGVVNLSVIPSEAAP